MKILFKATIAIMTLILLAGCNRDKSSYTYLMQHPNVLQERLEACQSQSSQECEVVKHAAQDFMVLNNEREQNQESFGDKLLQMQQDLAKKKTEIAALKNTIATHADNAAEQKKLATLESESKSLSESIAAMLAVIGSVPPE